MSCEKRDLGYAILTELRLYGKAPGATISSLKYPDTLPHYSLRKFPKLVRSTVKRREELPAKEVGAL